MLDAWRRVRVLGWHAALYYGSRHLRKAEINLGLLGWQQADYFSPEIEEQVKLLHDVETAQAALLNREAEISEKISVVQAQSTEAESVHDAAMTQLAAGRESTVAAIKEARSALEKMEAVVARFDKAMADLNEELQRADGERRLSLRMQLPEMQKIRDQKAGELAPLRETLSSLVAELSDIDGQAKQRREDFEAWKHALAEEVKIAEREKAAAQKKMTGLEREKRSPYLLIGRCLADCEVAPRNQPEALERVRDLRIRRQEIKAHIGRLRLESRHANARELRIFYTGLFAGVLLLAVLIVFLTTHSI